MCVIFSVEAFRRHGLDETSSYCCRCHCSVVCLSVCFHPAAGRRLSLNKSPLVHDHILFNEKLTHATSNNENVKHIQTYGNLCEKNVSCYFRLLNQTNKKYFHVFLCGLHFSVACFNIYVIL